MNWFRQDKSGKFLWPGFGENLRVLRWIIDRCENRIGARQTPIGFLPLSRDIDTRDLDIKPETLDELLAVDVSQWQQEMASVLDYLEGFGDRLPAELLKVHEQVVDALQKAG